MHLRDEPRATLAQSSRAALPSRPPLERLGRITARHALPVVLVWAVLVTLSLALALGALGGGSLFGKLSSGDPDVPGETRTGIRLLEAQETTGETLTLTLVGVDPASPAVGSGVRQLAQDLSTLDAVATVTTPYSPPGGLASAQGRTLVALDGRGVAVAVTLEKGTTEEVALQTATRARALLDATARELPGSRPRSGSIVQLVEEITSQVATDLKTGEQVALPISLLVMVLVFGGFVAAGLPLLGALASMAGALASLYGFASVIDLDASVVNVVTILGLGLCIDYGLLLVSRFREELRSPAVAGESRAAKEQAAPSREEVVDAVGRTVAVAGRTVLFSGLIVAISLGGLLVFDAAILRAIGAAGVSVVLVALLVALVLIPALLALCGPRLVRPGLLARIPGLRRVVSRLGDVAPPVGVFSALAARVQRRPWWVAGTVTALLVAAAVPALGMQLRASGTDMLPVGSDQRVFFEQVAARYPALAGPDVRVVARGSQQQVEQWSRQLAVVPGVAAVQDPRPVGELLVVGLTVDGGDPNGPVASDVVQRLRADRPDFATWVVGRAAGQTDFTDSLVRRTPLAVGLVVLATFTLLFLMTGSVLVPLKALLMNVVSLGASLGLVVLIFQQGHLEGLLSFTSNGGIDSTVPPLVLAFAFGLSMDYEVFLLARIKEERDAGRSNDAAVVSGLQRSGRIITSAALLVVIVFAGLLSAQLLVVKQMGVALVIAVLIDATIVRMLLVPATMTLLGERNWWAPGPLRRLHDRIGLSH